MANDMHLGLRVPNIWYRARLVLDDGSAVLRSTSRASPCRVRHHRGRQQWPGRLGVYQQLRRHQRVVVLEPVDGEPEPVPHARRPKELSRAKSACAGSVASPEVAHDEESIWGPVIGTDPQAQARLPLDRARPRCREPPRRTGVGGGPGV